MCATACDRCGRKLRVRPHAITCLVLGSSRGGESRAQCFRLAGELARAVDLLLHSVRAKDWGEVRPLAEGLLEQVHGRAALRAALEEERLVEVAAALTVDDDAAHLRRARETRRARS